ncbi:MAG: lipoprotein insertase outer membrane protein LolB [Pseudomonadota bacterium]
MIARAASTLLAALLLASCASLPPSQLPALPTDYEGREDILAEYDRWEVRGRVAIRTADDGFSAALNWRQSGERIDARLHGPLGRGTVLLEGDPEQLTLRHSDGVVEVMDDPEQSIRWRYGWTVPFDSFRYWVLGIGDPALDGDLEIAENGLLKSLEQGRWRVDYRDYQRVGAAELPRKLIAVSDDVRLTIVLKDWHIPLEATAAVR